MFVYIRAKNESAGSTAKCVLLLGASSPTVTATASTHSLRFLPKNSEDGITLLELSTDAVNAYKRVLENIISTAV
jgi:hypothetical protein